MSLNKHILLNPLRIIFSVVMGLFITVYQMAGMILTQEGVDNRTVAIVKGFKEHAAQMIGIFVLTAAVLWLIFLGVEFLVERFGASGSLKPHISESVKISARWKLILFFGYLVCFVPMIVIFYPGITTADTARQIAMFFHLPTRVAGSMATNGADIIYSAHHPLMTTWLYGGMVKLGMMFGSANLGVFFCTLMQAISFSAVFVWLTGLLKSFGAPVWAYRSVAVIWAVYPMSWYSVCCVFSDGLFSLAVLIFCGMLAKIVFTEGECLKNKSYVLGFILSILMMSFTKKQGVYFAFAAIVVLLIVYRRYYKQLLIAAVAVILVFNILFEGVVYRSLNVAQSGKQEILSLPMQQTARTITVSGGKISKEELHAFKGILTVSGDDADVVKYICEEYDPDLADPIKNRFNRDTQSDDALKQYLKTWFKGFFKSPAVYFDSVLASTYKYFYLSGDLPSGMEHTDVYTLETYMESYPKVIKKYGLAKEDYAYIDCRSPEGLADARSTIVNLSDNIHNVPIVRWLFSIGFMFYLVIICGLYLLIKRRWRELIILLPLLFTIAVCCISPMNGALRYAMPVMITWPFMLGLLFVKSTAKTKKSADLLHAKD